MAEWRQVIQRYLNNQYTEGELQILCSNLDLVWGQLAGTTPANKVDSLYNQVVKERRLYKLLIEMTREQRQLLFCEPQWKLHTPLYEQGIQLLDWGIEACLRPLYEIPPHYEKAWENAHLVFGRLKEIFPAYLQHNLLETLNEKSARLMEQDHWAQAGSLLQVFRGDLPNPNAIQDTLDKVTRPLELYTVINNLITAGQWGEAQARFDELARDFPHTNYPGVQELEQKLDRPRLLLEEAITAVEGGRWRRVEEMVETQLLPGYKNYPGVSELVTKLERLHSWMTHTQELVKKRAWEQVKNELDSLSPVDRTYPSVLEIQRKLEEGETLLRRACQQMDSQQWETASQTFMELDSVLPGFHDADAMRAAIQKGLALLVHVEQQIQNREWEAAEDSVKQVIHNLPQHKEAQRCLDQLQQYKELYASANQLFEAGRYVEAQTTYEALLKEAPCYQDGPERLDRLARWYSLYTAGLRHVEAREWEEARHILDELAHQQADYRDVSCLLTDVQRVIAVKAILRAPHINDPWLTWEQGACPYLTVQTSMPHITPAASTRHIQEAFNTLQEKAAMSSKMSAAWDKLYATDRRLFVDAYLYRVPQTDQVIEFIEEAMVQDHQFPSADKLASEFAETAPVVLLLMEKRDEAVEKWRARQRERPRSGAWAHALALCCLSSACEAEKNREMTTAIAAWRKALAQFVLAMHDRNYWREWGRERGEMYGHPILPSLTEELCQNIESDLLRRIQQRADQYMRQGRNDLVAQYRELELDFKVESGAVQLLKARGGLLLETGRQAWFGPLFLEWESGLVQSIARYCAELSNQPQDVVLSLLEGRPTESTIRRLRLYFSSLRYATALLETVPPDPENALEQLSRANCEHCPKTCDDQACTLHHSSTYPIRLCCPTCPNFMQRNPAYAQLPEPALTLLHDALYLATQAHLKLAAARIEEDEKTPLEAVTSEWQHVLTLAQDWEGEGDVREDIRQTALLGAARLMGHTLTQHTDTRRMDRAIALLDYVHQHLGPDKAVIARMAELLTHRGVYQANQNNHQEAKTDLERAYALMRPPTDHTRDNYATALILVAQDTAAHDPQEARQLLDQAAQLVQEGKRLRPEYIEYTRTEQLLELTRRELEGQPIIPPAENLLQELLEVLGPLDKEKDIVASLVTKAITMRSKNNLTAALEMLERAWQQTPHRIDVQEELVTTLALKVEQLETGNALAESGQLIDIWRERLADNPKMLSRLNFVKWIPCLKNNLDQIGFVYHMGTQEFMLPFDADVLGTVMVRLAIEEELLKLIAPLPLASLDDEATLSNLLQATGDLMCCKICSFETAHLALATCVPLTSLPIGRLELLALSLSRYADIVPAALNQMGALRNHIRRMRDINQANAAALNLTSPDLHALQDIVQARGWQWEQIGNGVNLIGSPAAAEQPAQRWRVKADFDGIGLSTDLGCLRPDGDQLGLWQRLLRLNGVLGLGKLTLTSEAHLRLTVDLPVVDMVTFDMAVHVLETHSEHLRYELTQS